MSAQEIQRLQQGIAEANRQLQQLAAMPYPPDVRRAHTQRVQGWIAQAQAHIQALQAHGAPAMLPGNPTTPNAAAKAARKWKRQQKKAKRAERQLKSMAQSVVSQLPNGSPLLSVANTLLDDGAAPDAKKTALAALVDSVPISSPIAPVAKAMAKSFLDDAADDDDDDDE